MTDVRQQRAFDAFVAGFLVPLLSGKGVLRTESVLGVRALAYFALATPSETDVSLALRDALKEAIARFAPARRVETLEPGELAIAIACHDLIAATDPKFDGLWARRAKKRLPSVIAATTLGAGAPETRSRALLRHAMISTLLSARREDEIVKSWAYTYRFYGRPVPRNVIALPRLRFIRRESKVRSLVELCDERNLGPVLDALVNASPLSELLLARRPTFSPTVLGVLADAALRSVAVRELAGRTDRLSLLAQAARELCDGHPSPTAAANVVALARDLFATERLDRLPQASDAPLEPTFEAIATASIRAFGFDALAPEVTTTLRATRPSENDQNPLAETLVSTARLAWLAAPAIRP